MTDAPTTTREQELQEEFKAGLDPDAVPQLATRIATLEAERDAMAADRDRASEAAASAQRERDEAVARADRAEKATAAAKAKVTRGEAPAKARNLKPMGDDAPSQDDVAAAIDEAIAAGSKVEIAFSDGRRELTQIPPVNVEGKAWRDHALGRMLSEPVEIKGAGSASLGIHGYALLIDGKQVAYQQRSDPLNVAPGQSVTLDNDIVF